MSPHGENSLPQSAAATVFEPRLAIGPVARVLQGLVYRKIWSGDRFSQSWKAIEPKCVYYLSLVARRRF